MLTFIYALVGAAALVALFLVPMVDAEMLRDWSEGTWIRHRFAREAPSGPPPGAWSTGAYRAALAWILVLFLGALALPR